MAFHASEHRRTDHTRAHCSILHHKVLRRKTPMMRMNELRRKSEGRYRIIWLHSWLGILALAVAATTSDVFICAWSPQTVHFTSRPRIQILPFLGFLRSTSTRLNRGRLALSSSNEEEEEEAQASPVPPKKDNNDDDVSERFKYKVNALMGLFDPPDAETDTEHKNGNILNAMLKFPIAYTFTVVGKKTAPDDNHHDDFVTAVENVILKESGVALKNELSTKVTPRGSKFTKVVVKVTVESSDMIASIYEKLQQLDQVVMHY